ncbi:MAG: ABC transporter ATP-binding protein [SAR202 cluster bacterium]|nr:ABC transporter ATP-binding protein [SAR202 cluster bacterium]MQG86654.1 ABC transporter ATP-binding protein [SAR202 cluster bacterium]|tara:strand:+ start:11512 stop:12156 length:645 start_codon:yes stop_codon:yes gene_type:complete
MFFFDHVSKSYGSNPVLVDTTLGIDKGQLVIISGSNGSGKTTLLKIAATLLSPDSGSIYMIKDNGDRIANNSSLRESSSYISHTSFLYDNLTVTENLNLFARLMKPGKYNSDWIDLLKRFDISKFSEKKVRELSHGTKKKVSICRSLIQPAGIMIWDEPDAGLDDFSIHTLSEIVNEQTEKGISVLLTSHNRSFVEDLDGYQFRLSSGSLESVN